MSSAPTYSSTLQLELLSVLATKPRRWVRLPFPAKVAYGRRPVEDVFESDTSRLFTTRRAPDAIDLSLQLDAGQVSRDVMEQIEELRRMNVPVYVYPRWPGATQYLWPLRRNIKGDPADAVYTGTPGENTTVYVLRASASRGVSLEAVDMSSPVVLPGIFTAEHIESAFPLGQGIGMFKARTNMAKNSLFGALTGYVPANWTATAGTPNTDMGVLSDSWLGVPALWLWGQSAVWTGASFSLTADMQLGISFGWKCDGVLTVKVNYDAGTDVTISVGPGAGYYRSQLAVPGVASSATIVIQGSTGMTYAEFAAPQIVSGAFKNDGNSFFLGSSGLDTRGTITACTARAVDLDIEPHLGESTPGVPDGYGMTAISGYVQPAWEQNFGTVYGLATLLNSRNGPSSVSAGFEKVAGDLGMFLKVFEDGDVQSTQSIDHTRGDAYAFVLYTGRKVVTGSPVEVTGCSIAKVGTPGTISTAEKTSAEGYTCFDRVYLGEAVVTDQSNNILDGIIGGYAVHSIRYADIATAVAQMANQDYVDLWRATMGKQYRILPNLSPSPWQRQYWGGAGTSPTIELTQSREL